MSFVRNAYLFLVYGFSLPHHLRTFFAPFKRVRIESTSLGLNLSELGEVISYNLVSIGMGIFLRTVVILTGFTCLVLLTLASPIILIILAIISPFKKLAQSFDRLPQNLQEFLKSPMGKFVQKKLVMPPDADFNAWLQKNLLDEKDVDRIKLWYQNLHQKPPKITRISGIGSDWSYGYTNTLNKFQVPQSTSPYPRVVGRDPEVKKIQEILTKTSQNSVLVAGEPGVGRHAVVDEFSRRLFAGQVLQNLGGFRTIYLDLKSAIAAQQSPLDLFEEGRYAGNIIIILDDFDNFFNFTDVFNQTLADGKLRIIGITSRQLSDQKVLQNSSLLKLFTVLPIEPPDIEIVYQEMEESIVPVLEKQHKVEISYTAIKEAIVDADRFISTVPFPEKAINILDETVSFVKAEHPHMIMLWGTDVQKYLSQKNQVPLGNLESNQKEKLANLEAELHKRVVGQEEAVSALSKALRRAVLEVSARNKPIGTFLFLGPTGVGKTETAKALAQTYFGAEARLVRFDMSQYQGEIGLERLLDELPNALLNNPFAVLLLDEIEKTPPIILNLFLTLLDEGYITSKEGKRISAKQNIIIGTSNAGALYIKNKGVEGLVDYIQNEKIFSPEFLNRFDRIVIFKPLTESQLKEVAKKLLAGVAARLADKKITLEFSDDLITKILNEGYDPNFGARSIRRYIQDTVEDQVSQKLLSDHFPPGSTLKI